MSQRIILVTCTYRKPKRLSFFKENIQIFKQVPNILWVIVEDGDTIDEELKNLLEASQIPYVYLNVMTRSHGNAQKNMALTYIRDHKLEGIVYVADDDNCYDVRLFEEIRNTKRIAVFPVGNLGPHGIERPIIKDGRIAGWDADWTSRKFPIDQGGYALNAKLLWGMADPVWGHLNRGGESEFIEKLIASADQLEILCNQCQTCYVWHNALRTPQLLRWPWITIKKLLRKYLGIHIVRF
jgi:hypothetical protein